MAVGQTKDAGWQIGVSTTLDHPIDAVWSLITRPVGIAIWLGAGVAFDGVKGEPYATTDGTTGELRSFHPHNRIRLTCRPAGWDHETTVQLAVQAQGDRTRLTLHQERLADADERERQRMHWKRVAARLTQELAAR